MNKSAWVRPRCVAVPEAVFAAPDRIRRPRGPGPRWVALSAGLPAPAHALAVDGGPLASVFLSLLLILGGFALVAWLARRYLPGVGRQGVVKVIGAAMVGPRERVVVVEIEDTWLLLGVGAGQVRLLEKRAKPGLAAHEATRG